MAHLQTDHILLAEPLTFESFKSFGTVIESPFQHRPCSLPSSGIQDSCSLQAHHVKATRVNQGTALKFSPILPVVNNYPNKKSEPLISLLHCFPTDKTVVLNSAGDDATTKRVQIPLLERHPFSSQTFVPLAADEAARYLVVVAPDCPSTVNGVDNPPDLRSALAFLAKPSQAITYFDGVWHAPIMVAPSKCSFGTSKAHGVDFVVTQFVDGTSRDCEEIHINVHNPALAANGMTGNLLVDIEL